MEYEIVCENIKCGGCSGTITSNLKKVSGVEGVNINLVGGIVTVTGVDGLRDELVTGLAAAGYPEVGSVEGLKAVSAKAKSYISCAIGKVKS